MTRPPRTPAPGRPTRALTPARSGPVPAMPIRPGRCRYAGTAETHAGYVGTEMADAQGRDGAGPTADSFRRSLAIDLPAGPDRRG